MEHERRPSPRYRELFLLHYKGAPLSRLSGLSDDWTAGPDSSRFGSAASRPRENDRCSTSSTGPRAAGPALTRYCR